tara:strand:+ start:3948 stop:5147 length:1200 start_codon:yes stop_codon:yes gene_type:complete
MKIYYAKAVYNNKEIKAVMNVLKNPLGLMDGPSVKILEKKVSKIFGKKYGLMVNSGSSANLLALASFNFKRGSEIITPSLTFSTTIAPIYQIGCVAHFIDVEANKFIANIKQIEKCINKKTAAIMIPNLLGNIAEWKTIFNIAKKHNLKVIEDSADTIGYSYLNSNTGKYSDAVTTSFYGAHLITGAGFGGMVCFNDKKLYEKAKMLRAYGRSSAIFNESEGIEPRFRSKVGGISYDEKYIFSDMGYNFIPSEISAAFGLQQFKKLSNIIKIRIKNFKFLKSFFQKYPLFFRLPNQTARVKTGWLAYPILLQKNTKFSRTELQIYLEKKGIQTRPIFTGNILRQPIMKNRYYKKHKEANKVSDDIMKNGLLIGCHHGMVKKDLYYIKNTIEKFLNKYKR